MSNTPKVGEVWNIRHSRKGDLTVKVLSDPSSGEWVDTEIVSGSPRLVSKTMAECGPGDKLTMRRAFITFLSKAEEQEESAS